MKRILLFISILFSIVSQSQVTINAAGRPSTTTINAPGKPGNSFVNRQLPAPAGTIYRSQDTPFTDGFSYTNDANLTVSTNQIAYNGSSGKRVDLKYNGSILYHQFEYWSQTYTINLGAMAANVNGFIIGVRSTNADNLTGFHIKGHSSTANRFSIQAMANSINTGSLVAGHTYTPGAQVTITLTRTLRTLDLTINDGPTPVTAQMVMGFDPYSTNYLPAVVTSFFMYFYTGTFTVTHYEAAIPYTNISFAFIGDSITQGQTTDTYEHSYGQLLKSLFSDGQVFAGRSSKTADIILTLPAIGILHPQKVTIMIGINDVVTSVPNATIQANYATIISGLQSYGIEVVLLSILPNGNNVIINNNWLQSTYPSLQYVDLWTALKNPATINMNPAYSSDSVHPNTDGHNLIFTTIQAADIALNRPPLIPPRFPIEIFQYLNTIAA